MSSESVREGLISYLPNLRAFAIVLCRDMDQADDLVQQAVLNAWKGLDTFQEGSNLQAWLFTILRNTYFSECRKRQREAISDVGELYISRIAVPPSQEASADIRDLAKALAQLTDEQREALLLVAAEGFAYTEAAEICNCRIGTIKSRVNRARKHLLEILGINERDGLGPEPLTQAVLLRNIEKIDDG